MHDRALPVRAHRKSDTGFHGGSRASPSFRYERHFVFKDRNVHSLGPRSYLFSYYFALSLFACLDALNDRRFLDVKLRDLDTTMAFSSLIYSAKRYEDLNYLRAKQAPIYSASIKDIFV